MAATKKDSKKTEGRGIFCDHKKPRYFIKKCNTNDKKQKCRLRVSKLTDFK